MSGGARAVVRNGSKLLDTHQPSAQHNNVMLRLSLWPRLELTASFAAARATASAWHRSQMARARDTLLRGIVVLCLGVCGIMLASPGRAALEVVPAIPLALDAGLFNGTGTLAYSMSGRVSAFDFAGGPPFTSADDFSTQNRALAQQASFALADIRGADAQFGGSEALAQGSASAAFGTLRASANAAGGGFGTYEAEANVTVSFVDLVQIDASGNLSTGFITTWAVNGSASTVPGQGFAGALAELWVVPFDLLPPRGGLLRGMYRSFNSTSAGEPLETAVGSLEGPEVVTGAKFWIVGTLTVAATSFKRCCAEGESPIASSRADFDDTAELFIDPPPGASLTAASGKDYRTPAPVPEPSTLVMLCAGLGVIGLMLRRLPGDARSALS